MAPSRQQDAASNHQGDILDPLIEQMTSIMRLSKAASPDAVRRVRRFSDADSSTIAGPSTRPELSPPVSVKSKDGSRWLPAPDQQSRTVYASRPIGSNNHASATESIPVEPHRCESVPCAVISLFETTELLELVLSFLDSRNVLTLRHTSRRWAATIAESPHLRLHAFALPQFMRPASEFQLLPLHLPGLSIGLGKPLHLGQWIHVSMSAEAARRISPSPGLGRRPRARSIFEGLRGGLGPKNGKSMDPWPARPSIEVVMDATQAKDLFVVQPPVVSMQGCMVTAPASTYIDANSGDDNDDTYDGRLPACAKVSCDVRNPTNDMAALTFC